MKIQLLLIVILTAFTAVEAKETKKVPAGQIAYYSFDQDTKDCLKDSVSGLNITKQKKPAADFKPGISGKALELQKNSKGQYICKNPKLTKLAPPFTISVWIKLDNEKTKYCIIVATGSDYAPKGFELSWGWRYLFFRMGCGPGKRAFDLKSTDPIISSKAWTNVAVSCDKKNAAMYINGKLVAKKSLPPEANFVPADGIGTTFTIGHFPSPFEAYKFVGLIDELRIFNRALSKEEIQDVMFLVQ